MEITNDSMRVAHHEAGHLVAAMLRGITFHTATIDPEPPYAGWVTYPPFDDPFTQAFVYFAGPYAEARFLTVPLDQAISSPTSCDDLAVFGRYRTRERDLVWGHELSQHWSLILQCAARLLLAGTITPHDPDPLQNASQIDAFLSRRVIR